MCIRQMQYCRTSAVSLLQRTAVKVQQLPTVGQGTWQLDSIPEALEAANTVYCNYSSERSVASCIASCTCRSVARSCPSLAKLMSSLKRGPRPCMLTLMDRLAEAAWVPCTHEHSRPLRRSVFQDWAP